MSVTLAKKYNGQDPTGWLLSEKLDGVRAVWDGQILRSRSGKPLHAPLWFTTELPRDLYLDGELWLGRGLFQDTVGVVRSYAGNWSDIKFMIFDVIGYGDYNFRLALIQSAELPAHCIAVRQVLCTSRDHLDQFEQSVLDIGGEGVMLRDALAQYEPKRSSSLLKLKRVKSDEAIVTNYTEGSGKYKGKLGALVCGYRGKVFKIGTGLSDELRDAPPPIGSIVTFEFFELTASGVPRFPVFIAVRDYE